ncbi:MAG: hypothetical protein JO000_07725 [Alphaproteobacteria bacterium]|nr:hypothetical protein [Alphaproteobacteria bacterium]
MPIVAKELRRRTAHVGARKAPRGNFDFVPKELAEKCRQLVDGYHALHGYTCLPDMLWQCSARNLIEDDRELRALFRHAVKQRGARQANDGFAQVATTICALEILVRDFAGWGARFPAARQAAERLAAAHPLRVRASLLEMYLYAQQHVRPAVEPPGGEL